MKPPRHPISAGTLWAVFLWLGFAAAPPKAWTAAPKTSVSDPAHLMLLDRRVVERVENAKLHVGTPLKHPKNPLLVPDKPWENATNNVYPNVIWDPQAGLWKLW